MLSYRRSWVVGCSVARGACVLRCVGVFRVSVDPGAVSVGCGCVGGFDSRLVRVMHLDFVPALVLAVAWVIRGARWWVLAWPSMLKLYCGCVRGWCSVARLLFPWVPVIGFCGWLGAQSFVPGGCLVRSALWSWFDVSGLLLCHVPLLVLLRSSTGVVVAAWCGACLLPVCARFLVCLCRWFFWGLGVVAGCVGLFRITIHWGSWAWGSKGRFLRFPIVNLLSLGGF